MHRTLLAAGLASLSFIAGTFADVDDLVVGHVGQEGLHVGLWSDPHEELALARRALDDPGQRGLILRGDAGVGKSASEAVETCA